MRSIFGDASSQIFCLLSSLCSSCLCVEKSLWDALFDETKFTKFLRDVKIWLRSFGGLPGEVAACRLCTDAAKKIAEPDIAGHWSFSQGRKRDPDRHDDFIILDLCGRCHT